MHKQTFTLLFVAAFLLALAGCNTIHGVGQDLEDAGQGIQDAAE